MSDKQSFIFYDEWRDAFSLLTADQQGQLIMAIFDFRISNVYPILDGAVGMAFQFIHFQLERDSKKYETKCEKNRQNGEKGGRPKKANGNSENRTDTEITERLNQKPKKPDDEDDDDIIPPKAPKGACVYSESFLAFWKAYPRKAAKPPAFKAFLKIAPDHTLLETILAALDEQKQSSAWSKEGGRYVPYPASWLNNRRWEDEPDTDMDGSDGLEYLA